MRNWHLIALLSAAMLLAAGCGASGLVKHGDASLQANRPAEAVAYYQRALLKDDDLTRDEEFQARFRQAKALSAYAEGQQLAQQSQWDQAIDRFAESLRIDPTHQPAADSLAEARRQASKAHHQKALQYADDGKLNEAIEEIRRALELNPENLDAQDALESVTARKQQAMNRASQLYQQAMVLEGQRRWNHAVDAFQLAVQANPNHLPARVERRRGADTLARAQSLGRQAVAKLGEKRLDDAIALFDQALNVWPYNESIGEPSQRARRLRSQAEQLYEQAVAQSAASQWDSAIASAVSALGIYPFHAEASRVLQETRLAAAKTYSDQGDILLAGEELDAAEQKYLRALTYLPGHDAARNGLGRIDANRGNQAAAAGLWGQAMLWYLNAGEHDPLVAYAKAAQSAEAKATERIAFAISVDVNDAALAGDLLDDMKQAKPGFVTLNVAGGAADFVAAASVTALDIHEKLVRTEHRTHTYTAYREVNNPAIRLAKAKLRNAELASARVERDFRDRCPVCRGRGVELCNACRGSGQVTCDQCGGDGKITIKRVIPGTVVRKSVRRPGEPKADTPPAPTPGRTVIEQRPCPKCGGDGKIACPKCGSSVRKGYVVCERCGGLGNAARVSKAQVQRKQADVRQARNRLALTPLTITTSYTASWPYTLLEYRKSGTLRLTVSLSDPATGKPANGKTLTKTFSDSDTTIQGANPSVGLQYDSLDLPTDSGIYLGLRAAAATDASAWLLAAALQDRSAATAGLADKLLEAGRNEPALEGYVDAALLLRSIDSPAAGKAIYELRKGLAAQPSE